MLKETVYAPSSIIRFLIACMLFMFPMQFPTGFGMRFAPSDLCLFLILGLTMGQLKLRRDAWSIWHFALVVIFAVGTYVALMSTGYISSYVIVQKNFGLLILFAYYVVLTSVVNTVEELVKFMKIFLIGVVLQNALTLSLYASGIEVSWMNHFYPRLSGMLVDPNAYGGLLVVALTFHVMMTYYKRPLIGGVWGTLTTLSLVAGIVLTFSRSAWIGMALVLLSIVMIRPSIVLRLFLLLTVPLTVALMYVDWNWLSHYAGRPSQIHSRLNIIDDAMKMFAESPIVGVGTGVYGDTHSVIIHNTSVWFLTEFGLLGFTVFIGFAFWFVWQGIVVYRGGLPHYQPLVIALVLAHVAMLGLSMGIEALYQRHWWFVLALIGSLKVILQYEMSSADETEGGRFHLVSHHHLLEK